MVEKGEAVVCGRMFMEWGFFDVVAWSGALKHRSGLAGLAAGAARAAGPTSIFLQPTIDDKQLICASCRRASYVVAFVENALRLRFEVRRWWLWD